MHDAPERAPAAAPDQSRAFGALMCTAFTLGASINVPLIRDFAHTGREPEPEAANREVARTAETAPTL